MKQRIQISEPEDKVEKTSQKEQEKRKRLKKIEQGLREMQDNMKRNNISIIGIPEGGEEEQGIENLFEKVMMENFPNLSREKFKSRKHRRSHYKDRESKQINLTQEQTRRISPKMETQRNNLQSKGKEESPERVVNEIEASKLSDIEFKTVVMRKPNELSENCK